MNKICKRRSSSISHRRQVFISCFRLNMDLTSFFYLFFFRFFFLSFPFFLFLSFFSFYYLFLFFYFFCLLSICLLCLSLFFYLFLYLSFLFSIFFYPFLFGPREHRIGFPAMRPDVKTDPDQRKENCSNYLP